MTKSLGVTSFGLLLSFIVSFYAEADVLLTKHGLEKIAQEIERAAARRDVDGILKYVSPDVRVVVRTRGRAGDQTVSMDYAAYKARLERNWAAAAKYTYKREKLDINIAPDQKEATLTAIVRETYVFDGRASSGRARETTTVRLVQGKPMITAMHAEQLDD